MGRVREPWPAKWWDGGSDSFGGSGSAGTTQRMDDLPKPPVLLVPDRERGGYKEHECRPARRPMGFR